MTPVNVTVWCDWCHPR